MIHDANKEKPWVDNEGLSDPVTVYTDNGVVTTAWWDSNEKYWCELEQDPYDGVRKSWFGCVDFWADIEFPKGWHYDKELYR